MKVTGGTAILRNPRGSVNLMILAGGTGFQVVSGKKAFSSLTGAGTFSLTYSKRAATATFHSISSVPSALVYTWHEIDGRNVHRQHGGELPSVLAQQIQLSDVISFTFWSILIPSRPPD